MPPATRPTLDEIEAKVEAGARLGRADGLALLESNDLVGVGRLADRVRRRLHGNRAWYILNAHVNHTNVCVNACRFCAFYRDPGAPDAYLLSAEAIVERAAPDVEAGATELHIVGGLHPALTLDAVVALVGRLREAFPGVCLQALTAVEVAHLADAAGRTAREALGELKAAGLTGLPGGGAEIFDPDIRRRVCPAKLSADRWLAVHAEAHALGLASNATMLYGHVETPAQRIDHLLRLRAQQDASRAAGHAGFLAFIPLSFHPAGTALADLPGPTAWDDLRTMAAARLVLDNVPHLKAFWIMLGVDLAQVALRFGADDINGTVVREEITHAAGARTPQALTPERMEALVRGAGLEPVERDTRYRRIVRGPGRHQWRRETR